MQITQSFVLSSLVEANERLLRNADSQRAVLQITLKDSVGSYFPTCSHFLILPKLQSHTKPSTPQPIPHPHHDVTCVYTLPMLIPRWLLSAGESIT